MSFKDIGVNGFKCYKMEKGESGQTYIKYIYINNPENLLYLEVIDSIDR